MAEVKTNRPFQQRFLGGFDRTNLRQEVEAVKPKRFAALRRKGTSWALGAALAFGGIGAPMKLIDRAQQRAPEARKSAYQAPIGPASPLGPNIATQIAGAAVEGVQEAGSVAASTVGAVTKAPGMITEKVREQFFHTEVPFGSIIYREAKKNDLRPELVAAVVQAESRFKPTARSGAGAVGLMQLVPRTGKWMGARDLTNPTQNIQAGTKYLKYLNERFDGNETKVIAAYNAGEGNVRRFGGVPPFKETRKYVSKVKTFEKEFQARVDNHALDMATLELR